MNGKQNVLFSFSTYYYYALLITKHSLLDKLQTQLYTGNEWVTKVIELQLVVVTVAMSVGLLLLQRDLSGNKNEFSCHSLLGKEWYVRLFAKIDFLTNARSLLYNADIIIVTYFV